MICQYIQLVVDFYILFLSSPLRRFPRSFSERIYIATVCLLSLNIVAMFQSSLATVFIRPMYYRNIANLEQFAETNQLILIKYPAMLADLFPEDSSDIYRTLHSRMTLVTNTELSASNVTDRGMATVTRRLTSQLSREENLVHLIPECARSYQLAYLLSRHSVFLESVNAIILDITRYGFINKWIEETNFKVKLENMRENPPVSLRARVLTINDLQLPFYILLIGIFISLATIFIEKVVKHYSRVSF